MLLMFVWRLNWPSAAGSPSYPALFGLKARFDDDRCEELLRGAFPKAIEASLLFGGTMAMTREGSNVRDT